MTEHLHQWINLIISAAKTFIDTARRPTVEAHPPLDADIAALTEATSRLKTLMLDPTPDFHHDSMNLIGAIRGYAEMLEQDSEALHPMLRAHLPALLSVVKKQKQGNFFSSDTNKESDDRQEPPGVILAVDDMPENRELITRLLSRYI